MVSRTFFLKCLKSFSGISWNPSPSTCRILMRLSNNPSFLRSFNRFRFIVYVSARSPFNPAIKFSPGSSFGNPRSPRSRPYLLTNRRAVFNCCESQLSQFAAWTFGSADSNPKDKTAPSESVSTRVLVISVEGSMFSAMMDGFPLSVCSISRRSSSRKP